MGITAKAVEAYKLYKTGKKAHDYTRLVLQSVDEETRPGALLKLGIKGMLEIASKALGVSLSSHPYFTYHKAHIEALAQALNASSNQDKAIEAFQKAVSSADATARLKEQLKGFGPRIDSLRLYYSFAIPGSVSLLETHSRDTEAARQLRESGHTPASLRVLTDRTIYEWRAMWCELHVECLQLLTMAHVEWRASEAAMKAYTDRMASLTKGGNFGRVAAHYVDQKRQLDTLDRMSTPGAASERAMEDPVGYSAEQVAKVRQTCDHLANITEFVMSDAAYHPSMVATRWPAR